MKTKNGKNWYIADLNCYTSEFLQEIILDLIDSPHVQVKMPEKAEQTRQGVDSHSDNDSPADTNEQKIKDELHRGVKEQQEVSE